ncbi:MAG: SufE family protein [Alcanivoracaceae bacterium]|jgi:cysteine desulfuration protein SufE|nr:SufE family protein [Alcanivoracaceae bacterium]
MESFYTDSPFGTSITAEEVLDSIGFLDDWEERYRYIIDLGKSLPALPEALKTDDRFVRGCQSQVWLAHQFAVQENKLYLAVDSDALIVRGLAAIVLAALNRKSPQEILDYDMETYFGKLDLLKHLSPTRGNGVQAMVARVRDEAQRLI